MSKYKVPFNKPFVIGKELYYLADSIAKGGISGNGYYSQACEKKLRELTGATQVLMTPSCTAALEMAAILIDLKPGDEVILPSFTFVSTANAVALRGAIPVFCDIGEEDFNMDVNQIKRLITPRTKAIIPVHYAGQACDMDAILDIAKENDLFVIEDAAQGLGSFYKGNHLGSIGDIGTLSFHETKNVICGEGGAILVNNKALQEQAEIIREKGTNRSQFFKGQVDKYTWVSLGSSFLPSDLQMAFLFAQLEQVQSIFEQRKKIALHYFEQIYPLEEKGCLRLPKYQSLSDGNYHIFPVLLNNEETRDKLISFLKQRGILAVFHYVPLHQSPAGQKYGRTPLPLPVTIDISGRLLRLPLYYELTQEDQNLVIEAIYSFFKTNQH